MIDMAVLIALEAHNTAVLTLTVAVLVSAVHNHTYTINKYFK